MDSNTIKELVSACFMAKKITEIMPELPKGLKPRHIHVIECISRIKKEKDRVCVSDVSCTLNITTPSVTKLINELEEKDILIKENKNKDKRVVTLALTDLGEKYNQFYVVDYHNRLAKKLENLSLEDSSKTINTIKELYTAIKEAEREGVKYE